MTLRLYFKSKLYISDRNKYIYFAIVNTSICYMTRIFALLYIYRYYITMRHYHIALYIILQTIYFITDICCTVSAFDIASMDTQLMNLYFKTQEPSQQQLFSNKEIEDIYTQARTQIEAQETYSIIVPIQQTYEQLWEIYPSCSNSLKRSDIISILSQEYIFLSDISGILRSEKIWYPTTEAANTSCKVFTQCKDDLSEFPKSLTIQQYNSCQQTINSLYSTTKRSYNQSLLLQPPIIDDTMFVNGTLEDSPYDLLVDIGQISRLLYESPTNPPVVTFFAMPTLPGDDGWIMPLWWSLVLQSWQQMTTWNTNTLNTPRWSLFSGMAYSGWLLTGVAYNNTRWFTNNTMPWNQSWISRNNTNRNNSPLIRNKPWFIEDPLTCDISYQPTPEESSSTSADIIINQLPKSDTNRRITDILWLWWLSFGSWKNGGTDANWGTTPETIDLIINQWFDVFADPNNDKTKECLTKCDRFGLSDKLLCQARCLCGQVNSPGIGKVWGTEEYLIDPWAFIIKYCQIPATAKTVVANKSVMSIQDIINEMRNVVKNLRDWGQLIKHTKTKEHLDTSMSKIKLWQILAFDLAIAFKPIFNQPEPRIKQKDLKEEIKRTEQLIKQKESDTAIRAQRNKYLIIGDPCSVETIWSITENIQEAQSSKELQQQTCREQSTSITSSQLQQIQFSADMFQSLSTSSTLDGFVASQARFWREMRQLLWQISSISSALRVQINKWS